VALYLWGDTNSITIPKETFFTIDGLTYFAPTLTLTARSEFR